MTDAGVIRAIDRMSQQLKGKNIGYAIMQAIGHNLKGRNKACDAQAITLRLSTMSNDELAAVINQYSKDLEIKNED